MAVRLTEGMSLFQATANVTTYADISAIATSAWTGGIPADFRKVANITSIDSDGGSRTEIDATNTESPAKEQVYGLIDYGSITLNIDETDDTSLADMRKDLNDNKKRIYAVLHSDYKDVEDVATSANATVEVFVGFVNNPDAFSAAVDDKVSKSVTIRRSGAVKRYKNGAEVD